MSATLPRVLAGAAGLVVVATWVGSGSLVTALLVLVLVAGLAAAGVVVSSWVLAGPRPDGDAFPGTDRTADLARSAGPGHRVRRALRGLLARPWVRGDALVRAATTRLGSEDALVFTPRGRRVAAPHLWVEWNPTDLAEVAARWPLDVLARELVDGYAEQARRRGVHHLTDRTWLHLLAGADVPVGRVVVTAAFSHPQQAPVESACAPAGGRADAGDSARPPGAGPPRTASPRGVRPPPPGDAATTTLARAADPATTAVIARRDPGSALWQRVLPALRTIRAPRAPAARTPSAEATETVGVLVAETGGATDIVLSGTRAVTIGRDPSADAVVPHAGVSWRHLTVTRQDTGTWTVADAGSTNGTEVDGHRVTGPVTLRVGGVVGLGADGPRYRLALRRTGPGAGDGRRVLDRTRVEVT